MKYIDQLFKDRADTANIGELLDVACKKVDELNGQLEHYKECHVIGVNSLEDKAKELIQAVELSNNQVSALVWEKEQLLEQLKQMTGMRDRLADITEDVHYLLIESMGSEPIEGMDIKQAVILLISQRDNARSKKQSENGNDV